MKPTVRRRSDWFHGHRLLGSLLLIVALVAAVGSTVVRAQVLSVPVFDATNYAEAIIEAFDLFQEITMMAFQAQPLPVDMAARYAVFSPPWYTNTLASPYPVAAPVLGALNLGDPYGTGYEDVVDPLAVPTAVLATMPPVLQRAFADRYATIQLADSVAALGINQTGEARANGNDLLQVLQSMQADASNPLNSYQTQTALLDKLTAASVVTAQVAEETNQFLSTAIEELVVTNKRQRDTEAALMNAVITQWSYGPTYGQALFSRTAVDLNGWHLP